MMKQIGLAIFALSLFAGPASSQQAQKPSDYVPEEGSVEVKKKKKKRTAKSKKVVKLDPALPNVLIIGDSISMGYTPFVTKALAGKANVLHNPGNSQGTTHGLANLDKWTSAHKWDVIHFNFGLHDLKRVLEAGTSRNSNDPNDPFQADLPTYTSNLTKIVARLKQAEAKLIFATTTPFPAGVKPFRDPADVPKYNAAALAIMKENDIEVNDLSGAILPHLETMQKPINVHFHKEGSAFMAEMVAGRIAEALVEK